VYERKLLSAAIQDRGAFEAIELAGEGDRFDDTLVPLWGLIKAYYDRDESAAHADPDLLRSELEANALNPKRGRQDVELLNGIVAEEVSVGNVKHILRKQVCDRAGLALAAALAGRKPEAEVRAALEAYEQAVATFDGAEEDDVVSWTEAITREVDSGQRMALSPKVLNQYIRGGVLPGHNVTIFGRPESGKTALAITMACGFARRGYKVLYVGNEDPIQDLMIRAVCNLTGWTADEVAADPDRAEAIARDKGALNLVMVELAPGTVREIEAMVKKHKPDVLFVDQLRNVVAGKSDNYTRLLDMNAQAIRAIGKRHGIATVSVTQAGDSADGRPILTMGDVDSSNTGIPGAADLMIGVGVTEALDTGGQRMLSLCKNKLGYVKANQLVSLDPFRSRMK